MIIWAYNLPRFVMFQLTTKYDNVRCIEKTDKLLENIKPEDKFICFWDDTPTLRRVEQIQNETFPNRKMIDFAANREQMTKFVNEHSKFKAERMYFKFEGEEMELPAPRLSGSLKVVAKIGEEHKGQDKFLVYPGQKILAKDSIIFEEFVENAHSFRVLLIGEDVFIIDYLDDPYQPKPQDQHWIKNINPILEENLDLDQFKEEIKDTKKMAKLLNYDYVGVDYVKNEERTVCLELNTFPGVRLNERIQQSGLKYWINKIENMLN